MGENKVVGEIMTYTYKIKDEIFKQEILNKEEKLAEIRAILILKGAIIKDKIELKLESKELSERVYRFLKDLTQLEIIIKYSKSKKFGEHNLYVITVPTQKGSLNFIENLYKYNTKSNKSENIVKGFIRGIFLGCGYIKNPQKEYALDFFIDSESISDELYNILLELNKKVYKTMKLKKTLIYLRNAEDIMDIIVIIGCIKEFYNYEEIIMMKDLKNKTIREMNWEVANETKTLATAGKQIKMINFIGKHIGLNELSSVLEEIAFLRLKNPEASLQELADIIGISKSGVRNRFRRLEQIHKDIFEKEREE